MLRFSGRKCAKCGATTPLRPDNREPCGADSSISRPARRRARGSRGAGSASPLCCIRCESRRFDCSVPYRVLLRAPTGTRFLKASTVKATHVKKIATIRKSVFDSATERAIFKRLQTRWSHIYNLWPNLPFSKLLDVDVTQISQREKTFYVNSN